MQSKMNQFGIKQRTVRKSKSETETIIKMAEQRGIALQTKSTRPPKFCEIEDCVLCFIQLARAAKISVTQDVIIQRALVARQELIQQAPPRVDINAVKKLTASFGRALKFTKRHCIPSPCPFRTWPATATCRTPALCFVEH